jgi:predicted nucleic acid-binding protein
VRFADTNVLLYAISRDREDSDKSALANDLLGSRDIAISVQVLQEFYVQATRPTREDRLTHEQAYGLVSAFLRFHVQDLTASIAVAAMAARDRFGISFWDAAIIEAARESGCSVVLSEDLADGQDYGGVTVRNPFA